MNDRISNKEIFMRSAILFSQRRKCDRKKVGAVLVKADRIICCGYNGVLSHKEHCYEHFKKYFNDNNFNFSFEEWINSENFYDLHREFSIFENHAESNLISFAARNGICTDKSDLYITLSPCLDCSKLIVSSGILNVFYLEEYDRDVKGIEFLKNHGLYVENYKINF